MALRVRFGVPHGDPLAWRKSELTQLAIHPRRGPWDYEQFDGNCWKDARLQEGSLAFACQRDQNGTVSTRDPAIESSYKF
jgi:hypothetical protein